MISNLSVRNFKCFDELSLPMGPLTLLSGLNGMGKSSVIQALLLLRQSWQQGLLGRGQLALNGDLVQIGTAQDALYGFAEEEKISLAVQFATGRGGRWDLVYSKDSDVLGRAQPSSGTEDIGAENLFGASFQYLSAERLGPRPFSATSDYAVRHRRELGPRGEYTAHFLSLFGQDEVSLQQLVRPDASARSLKAQVEAWMDVISPGTRLSVTPYSSIDVVQLQFRFVSGRDLTDLFRPTNVGFGLTFALPLLVGVLAAKPDSLIMIENPEAHLHPRGQVAMGRFLSLAAASGAQVVVETHSDHVLNGIRLSVHSGALAPEAVHLHFFGRRQEGDHSRHRVASPRLDRDARIDQWPEGFFDEWEQALDILLSPPERERGPGIQ